jgi:hypothetical protein
MYIECGRSDVWIDPLPLGACLVMMLFDSFIYLALAAYCDKVKSAVLLFRLQHETRHQPCTIAGWLANLLAGDQG